MGKSRLRLNLRETERLQVLGPHGSGASPPLTLDAIALSQRKLGCNLRHPGLGVAALERSCACTIFSCSCAFSCTGRRGPPSPQPPERVAARRSTGPPRKLLPPPDQVSPLLPSLPQGNRTTAAPPQALPGARQPAFHRQPSQKTGGSIASGSPSIRALRPAPPYLASVDSTPGPPATPTPTPLTRASAWARRAGLGRPWPSDAAAARAGCCAEGPPSRRRLRTTRLPCPEAPDWTPQAPPRRAEVSSGAFRRAGRPRLPPLPRHAHQTGAWFEAFILPAERSPRRCRSRRGRRPQRSGIGKEAQSARPHMFFPRSMLKYLPGEREGARRSGRFSSRGFPTPKRPARRKGEGARLPQEAAGRAQRRVPGSRFPFGRRVSRGDRSSPSSSAAELRGPAAASPFASPSPRMTLAGGRRSGKAGALQGRGKRPGTAHYPSRPHEVPHEFFTIQKGTPPSSP